MPPASATTASGARARTRKPAPARGGRKAAPARIRWDRLARVAMLCVVCTLLYLYISAGVSFFSTWREAKHVSAQVGALERENTRLKAQHQALATRTSLWRQARILGMAKPGEVTYIVRGLPNN